MDQSLATQLQTTLNTVPAFTWYSLPSGTLTFVNHRYADYLGLASDHPLRFGVETGVAWDTDLQLPIQTTMSRRDRSAKRFSEQVRRVRQRFGCEMPAACTAGS